MGSGQDIYEAISANEIKNYNVLVLNNPPNSGTSTLETYVKNTPNIASLSGLYVDRLDAPRYYTGDAIT